MALMGSGDSAYGSIGNPPGTGRDPANPSAGGTRRDTLQADVYGTEYANPARWGPAMPPYPDAPEKGAEEAQENYLGGDRQPQMQEVDIPVGGLRADSVAQQGSATSRGDLMLERERPDVPNRTWLGQNGGSVAGGPTSGAGGGRGRMGRDFGTTQTVSIADGGVRAGGMISLPAHISSTSPAQSGPAS